MIMAQAFCTQEVRSNPNFPIFAMPVLKKTPMAYGRLPMPTFAFDGSAMEKTVFSIIGKIDPKTLVRLPLSVVYARWPRFGQPSVIWSTT